MTELVSDLRRAIPGALESDEVAGQRNQIVEERGRVAANAMEELKTELEDNPYVALIGGKDAMMVVAARGGEPLPSDVYNELPEDVRETIDAHVRDAGKQLFQIQRKVHRLQRDAREKVAEFHQEVTRQVVTHHIAVLLEKYSEVESVKSFLHLVGEDMVKNADEFITANGDSGDGSRALGPDQEEFFTRYRVNPLVTNAPGSGAPVILESNPSLKNLLGQIEGQMRFGVMVTDFSRIAPGAAHRANGGYLIVKAEDVLTRPLVWPALKRTLQTRELRPADAASELGVFATESLEPQAIPARIKVVLIGEPHYFYLLQGVDVEFAELFKVKVDFTPHMDRTADTERSYARFVAAECEREGLSPFDSEAMARIVEEGSRITGDQTKLTTRLREVGDLVKEAAHHSRVAARDVVTAEDVETALRQRARRNRRPHRQLLEMIERGVLSFEPEGEAVGQLYGIGLLSLSDEAFGRPIRVMASAFLGTRGVINIEREARLSGRIHNKGFLVLSGYLGWRFAQSRPLILSASLSFDQLYEEVEGDSASAAELYALMSAISGVPVRQGIGVTGAVNQEGLILPVGGVTQKIEGFYAACERVGFTGEQGVMLPRRNVENLVVRREIREAVAEGRFHVWAIDRVEDGWPILTGLQAGETTEDGTFPEGTVHHAVMARLSDWGEKWKGFGSGQRQEDEGDEE
jgi:lon-related putative ATP-dependent protease